MITLSDNITSIDQYVSKFEDITKYWFNIAIYKPWMNGTYGQLYVSGIDL
jgi:precorrin-3B methylase